MNKATVAQRIVSLVRPYIAVFDPMLLAIWQPGCDWADHAYSAGNDFPWRITDQIRNFGVAFALLFLAANVSLNG